ncbi:uncharacterized protein BJ212DRAFT_1403000 [Suillus subaureus]|uniref:Uncharacterized protein n=1 Tax=Suillus subaureus TaxID=48587 RepID=A0A9P7DMU8_9AGAM|nr:uncharacterized protein BJ212DRAFT_1403000 [Suillus subaureus]KAG1798771.1 hypothetical protein BJ212DRAFT_1403000 [Suillus subaureus]
MTKSLNELIHWVVIPRSLSRWKGLLSAIRDSDLVTFMEPRVLYRLQVCSPFPLPCIHSHLLILPTTEQVPIDDFALAFSRAEILIPGSGLALPTWDAPVYHCESTFRLLDSPPPSLAPLIPPYAAPRLNLSISERYGHGL